MPVFAPEDNPLDPPALSLPASAVGVVVYNEASVSVPTAEDATTTVVIVVKPVVPSLVTGATEIDSELVAENMTDVLVVMSVSGVNVEVSLLEDSEACDLLVIVHFR